MDIKGKYTFGELSKLTGIPRRTLSHRFKREHITMDVAKGPGGDRYVIAFSDIPADLQLIIYKGIANSVPDGNTLPAVSHGTLPAPPDPADQDSRPALAEEQYENALAKADLLRFYLAAVKKAPRGKKTAARSEFMLAYNSGVAYPKLYKVIGDVAWQTVEGWKRVWGTEKDPLALADNRGYWKRGSRRLTVGDEQKKILLACALHPNRLRISEAIRTARAVMNAQGIANGHSDATYRRWLFDWASMNQPLWVFSREGAKAWNDTCAYYIERDYSLINVGDIVVADGHILNFEIINPWTGKPKRMMLIVWLDMKSNYPLGWEIMPTENTYAISSALRRAILRLGKYPKVAYLDNGRAFKAKFFKGVDFEQEGFDGLYERMGIRTIFAWPYHGQSKTVERFFGSFAEIERWAPTYVGTSIERKPPRMMRGERLHRKVYDKLTGGEGITLEQAHRAIASWFDVYASRPQRGHLEGRTPLDVFEAGKGPGVDPNELQSLMLDFEVRNIKRNGISFLGQHYYDPALYSRRHPVIVRYDIQDPSCVYVFEKSGRFICEARPVEKIHPAANILGTAEDRERLTRHIEMKKQQEKEASASARRFLETEVMPQTHRMLESAGLTLQGPKEHAETENVRYISTPSDSEKALQKEIDAILEKKRAERTKEQEETERRIAEGMRQYRESLLCKKDINPDEDILKDDPKIWKVLPKMNERDRYEKLAEFEVRGWMIPKRWQAFMTYFEQTPEYEGNKDYYDEHRARIACMYQLEADTTHNNNS